MSAAVYLSWQPAPALDWILAASSADEWTITLQVGWNVFQECPFFQNYLSHSAIRDARRHLTWLIGCWWPGVRPFPGFTMTITGAFLNFSGKYDRLRHVLINCSRCSILVCYRLWTAGNSIHCPAQTPFVCLSGQNPIRGLFLESELRFWSDETPEEVLNLIAYLFVKVPVSSDLALETRS